MQKRLLSIATLALALSALAEAQVTPVGPFVGDDSEGFETPLPAGMPFVPCITPRIFNGTADLCSPTMSASMHTTSSWGFMCTIFPHSGSRFFGSTGGSALYTFDTDATQFGGYFGTNSWAAGNPNNDFVTVTFFDRMGNQIDSVVTNVVAPCTWTWNGWSSPVGIASVLVTNSAFGGAFVNMDDMEVTHGPAGLGTNYCTANANSTGQTAEMSASGTNQVAMNNVTLVASDMPHNSFGFFLTSQTAANTPNPGGSAGVLCLGGTIGRYVGPGQIKNSGNTGSISLAINLTQTPTPTGLVSVTAGQTWRFQSWFRDTTMGGAATSNFSDGLEIAFN